MESNYDCLKYDELKIGEIYKTSYPTQGDYIFRHNDTRACKYMNAKMQSFYLCGDMTPFNGFEVYELPTDEEIRHFKLCEQMGKYIPFDQLDCNPLFIN